MLPRDEQDEIRTTRLRIEARMVADSMKCFRCGGKASAQCACGARMCDRHAHFYFDDANYAVSNSARPKCELCVPPKYPRPYEMVRAVEQDEWWI